MRRISMFLAAGLISVTGAAQTTPSKKAAPKTTAPAARNMTVTTNSPAARKSYDEATFLAENLRTEEARDKYRAAVKQDPNFALAWAQIDRVTRDPKEEAKARKQAKALAPKTSKGEQLLIKWIVGYTEGDFVMAIAAMNDLQAMYPTDPHLGFVFGQWLIGQQSYDRGAQILEQATKAHPDYAPAYNELGYAYSYMGEHDEALRTMKRYVELLPKEPNPHDSYAELSRLAGRYDDAIAHYQEALKILPTFTSSQLGIADTYALKGDQNRARAEYDKAIAAETSPRDKEDYKFQRAMTYIREKDFAGAEKAFTELAADADKAGYADLEAECHRAVASIQTNRNIALKHIEEAEAALKHSHELAQATAQQELGRVLRSKAVIAEYAGKNDVVQATLKQLEQMASRSRDQVIQASLHGAKGGVLFAKKQYAEAATELADDGDNALSQSRLAEAYAKSGKEADAKATREHLNLFHRVLLEDALVRL